MKLMIDNFFNLIYHDSHVLNDVLQIFKKPMIINVVSLI